MPDSLRPVRSYHRERREGDENRPRRTHYRGRLLIHAGVRRTYGGHSTDYWATLFEVNPRGLTYGAIVGAVDLIDCVKVGALPITAAASPHAIGPWCWMLANAQYLIEPVPLRGKLGLFRPDSFTLARVGEQLPRAFKLGEVSSW